MASNIRNLRPDRSLRSSHLLAVAFVLVLTATQHLPADDSLPAEITGSGTIIDADTGGPVPGAKVTIWEFGPDNSSRHHECLSHGDGKFEFTVATDHAVTDSGGTVGISLTIDVKHPNYVLPVSPPTPGWLQVAVAKPSPPALLRQLQAAVPQAAVPQAAAPQAAARPLAESPHVLRPVRVVSAKPVSGILQSPDRKPAPGVRIYAFSSLKLPPELQLPRTVMAEVNFGNRPEYQASLAKFQDDTTTDDQGRFEMLVPAAGETLLSIWPAKDFAISSHYIADRRGDVGAIVLKKGTTITGRLLNADDKPTAGAYVHAGLQAPYATQNPNLPFLIWRATTTDAQGSFAFAPLPPGEYLLEPREVASDLSTEHRGDPPLDRHPLPAYFAVQKVILSDDQPSTPIEIRPAPMVQVAGHAEVSLELLDAILRQSERTNLQRAMVPPQPLLDALRRKREKQSQVPDPAEPTGVATTRVLDVEELRQFSPTIHGLINGFPYQANAEIDVQGNFKVRAPRGLTDGILHLHSAPAITSVSTFGNSSQPLQPKWRTDQKKPLVTGNEIPLGEIDADIGAIEIVYPGPPEPAAPARPGPRPARGVGS